MIPQKLLRAPQIRTCSTREGCVGRAVHNRIYTKHCTSTPVASQQRSLAKKLCKRDARDVTVNTAQMNKDAETDTTDTTLASMVDPARLTSTIFSMATSDEDPSVQMLQFFYAASGSVMERFTGVQLAQICWSLACLGVTFPPVDDLESDEQEVAPPEQWATAFMARLGSAVGEVPPLEMVASVWALANLRAAPEPQLVDAMLRQLQPHLEAISDDCLTRLMLALTKLHHQYSEEFAEEVVVASVARLQGMCGEQLGVIGYALARRGLRPAQPWLEAYKMAIITPEYHMDAIADVAYTLAVFQVQPPEEWVKVMQEATLDPHRCPMPLMSPCALTDLIWAQAVLKWSEPPMQWYIEFMGCFGAKLDLLAEPDLVRWLWAMARLDYHVPGDTYAMQLFARATAMLEHGDFSARDLAYAVRACNAIFLHEEGAAIRPEVAKPVWLESFYSQVFAALEQMGGQEEFRLLDWDVPPGLPSDHIVCRKK